MKKDEIDDIVSRSPLLKLAEEQAEMELAELHRAFDQEKPEQPKKKRDLPHGWKVIQGGKGEI